MNLGKQRADAVQRPRGLVGKVFVEAGQDLERGENLAVTVDLATAIQRSDRVGLIHDHQHLATVLKPREEVAQFGLVLRERLVEQLLHVEVESADVMAALPDVQADHDRKACAHDAVLPWSIIAGRSLDTRCRHPRYEDPSDELSRVPISGQRVSPDRAATPRDR